MSKHLLSQIPAINKILLLDEIKELMNTYTEVAIKSAIKQYIEEVKQAILNEELSEVPSLSKIVGEVARIVDECGIFLRWRNTYGGWSYWLFSQDYTEDVKTKSLGSTLIKDSYVGGGEDIFYPFGMTSKKTWTLTSEVPVLDYEIEEIKSLFVSSEIYIWRGKEVRDIFPKHWERVNVVEGTQKFKHNSQYTHPLSVTIEFQEPKTITQL